MGIDAEDGRSLRSIPSTGRTEWDLSYEIWCGRKIRRGCKLRAVASSAWLPTTKPRHVSSSIFRLLDNSIACRPLQNRLGPVLERVLHLAHELVRHGAIHHAMFVGERE